MIEPLAAAGSDASIVVEWRAVQLGAQRSVGCTVRVPTGHTLSLLVEQGIYRKALSGSDVLELAAIPVATAGTEGRITLRDDTSGMAAQYAWLWQAPGGKQRPNNFDLPPPGARAGPAGVARGTQTETAAQPRPVARGIGAKEAKAAGAATAFFGQPALGRRVAFILDMSGSMTGSRWETCMHELAAALQALSGDSEFFVVLFSDRLVEPPGQLGWMIAHKDVVAGVTAWMQGISPAGGTMPAPAFERVYGLAARPDAVYFLTDGEFHDCTPAAIARLNTSGSLSRLGAAALDIGRSLFGRGKDSPPAVIHTIALDDASSAAALRQIAQDSGGEFTHASSE